MDYSIERKNRQTIAVIVLIVVILISFSIAISNGVEYVYDLMSSHSETVTAAIGNN